MVLGRAGSCSMIQQGTGEAHPWASAQGALGHQAPFPMCALSSCGSISPACTHVCPKGYGGVGGRGTAPPLISHGWQGETRRESGMRLLLALLTSPPRSLVQMLGNTRDRNKSSCLHSFLLSFRSQKPALDIFMYK